MHDEYYSPIDIDNNTVQDEHIKIFKAACVPRACQTRNYELVKQQPVSPSRRMPHPYILLSHQGELSLMNESNIILLLCPQNMFHDLERALDGLMKSWMHSLLLFVVAHLWLDCALNWLNASSMNTSRSWLNQRSSAAHWIKQRQINQLNLWVSLWLLAFRLCTTIFMQRGQSVNSLIG